MTIDQLLADVSRAVRAALPDRAERIIVELERRLRPRGNGEYAVTEVAPVVEGRATFSFAGTIPRDFGCEMLCASVTEDASLTAGGAVALAFTPATMVYRKAGLEMARWTVYSGEWLPLPMRFDPDAIHDFSVEGLAPSARMASLVLGGHFISDGLGDFPEFSARVEQDGLHVQRAGAPSASFIPAGSLGSVLRYLRGEPANPNAQPAPRSRQRRRRR